MRLDKVIIDPVDYYQRQYTVSLVLVPPFLGSPYRESRPTDGYGCHSSPGSKSGSTGLSITSIMFWWI